MVKNYSKLQQDLKTAKGLKLVDRNFRLSGPGATKANLQRELNRVNKSAKDKAEDIYRLLVQARRLGGEENGVNVTIGRDINIRDLLQNIPDESVARYPVIKFGDVYYTLTDSKKREHLRRFGSDRFELYRNQVHFEEETGSDEDYTRALTGRRVTDVLIFYKTKEKKRHKEGAFFKWTCKLPIDLSRYQIYRVVDAQNYKDNCFIHALKMWGQLTPAEISVIKYKCTGDYVPLTAFKKLVEDIPFGITVTRIRNHKDTNEALISRYNGKATRVINLGLIGDHYFLIEPTKVTAYAVKNYDKLKNKKDWNKFIKKNERDETRYIDTLKLVKLLIELKETHLDEIKANNEELMKVCEYNQLEEKITDLEFTRTCIIDHEYIAKTNKYIDKNGEEQIRYKHICYFDFETTTEGDNHITYMVSYCIDDGPIQTIRGPNCANLLLQKLDDKTLCIAHNLGYDIRFILSTGLIYNPFMIQKSATSIPFLSGTYYKNNKPLKLTFTCSYAMISTGLGQFSKMFNLKGVKKEILPYGVYTQATVNLPYIKIQDALKVLKDADHKDFIANIKEWGLERENGCFDHMMYSQKYCEMDVRVLKEGYTIFRSWMKDVTGLDTTQYITLASMSIEYLKKEGCFNGCKQLSGTPRMFIQQCVVGGRTMCSENKKIYIKDGYMKSNNKKRLVKVGGKISDFDGVSLYPSAMVRMKGFLKGTPKIIPTGATYNDIKDKDGYFVEITITKIGINRKMPLLSYKSDEDVRMFENKVGTYFVDKTGLEDLIKFQKIEFSIVRGYYFDEGHNPKIKTVMKGLFDKRAEKKKEKNPIEQVYKLLMNASYGKTCLKPITKETKILTKKQYNSFVDNNYNHINFSTSVYDTEQMIVNVNKPINTQFNYCHIGVEILSMSKRIMNEVICLAEDLGINIYYQDTDSMHIDTNDIPRLSKAYKEMYNRELVGTGLGQFHEDFDFKRDPKIYNNDKQEVYAIESIFLGKKSYIDKVKIINYTKITDENPKEEIVEEFDYHIRMKGIPGDVLMKLVNEDYEGNPMKLYEDMYNRKKVKFDLLSVRIKFLGNADLSIRTRVGDEFMRELQF